MTISLHRRRHPTLVRKASADDVYELLAPNYPASTLGWVKDATWRRMRVNLDDINMSRRPGGRDPDKVRGIEDAIASGKTMDPVVLVSTLDGFDLADGYHRTLAYQHAGATSVDAWVASGTGEQGPWLREMHDQKINKEQPDSAEVHIETASGTRKRKRSDEPDEILDLDVSVLKTDDEARVVWGVVLEPDVEDTQGDVVSKEDVELAAHRFLYDSRPIGDQHARLAPSSVRPVESYIAPCDFELGGQTVRKGSWVLATHVPDDDLWAQVRGGGKGAYSVAGTGKRTPL